MTSRLLSRIEKLEADERLRASASSYSAEYIARNAEHVARSYVNKLLQAAKDGPEGQARFDALLKGRMSSGETMAEVLGTDDTASRLQRCFHKTEC